LAQCTHADKTHLYIGLDCPNNDSHKEGYKQISNYIPKISGFKEVTIVQRCENYGSYKNMEELTKLIYQQYDRMIETDDDNVFSINFLDYINKGLDRYEDDQRIIAVCGDGGTFIKPKDYSANHLFRKGFSAWGYGTWKGRIKNTVYSPETLLEFISDDSLRRSLISNYEYLYYVVLSYILRAMDMWGDGAIALDMIKNHTYCVYPTVSKVRNYGHDGSGEHGGRLKNNSFVKVRLDDSTTFEFEGDPVFDDPRYVKMLCEYSRVPLDRKIKFWLKVAKNPRRVIELLKLKNIRISK